VLKNFQQIIVRFEVSHHCCYRFNIFRDLTLSLDEWFSVF